jgi:hypothetical protein
MGERATTGTVYALVDPRDSAPQYIGATTQILPQRLRGHLGGKAAPKVRAWVTELRTAGLRPLIIPLRKGVPAAELLTAEAEEITRVIAVGGALLNEHSTALGRELDRLRRESEREAAEREAWTELATVAMSSLGGPMPPGKLPEFDIPDKTWWFMSEVAPGLSPERYRTPSQDQKLATHGLLRHMRGAWPGVLCMASEEFERRMERCFENAVEIPFTSRTEASRYLTLAVWYMIAVEPWRHLAQIAGLPLDNASFAAWADHNDAREALEFLTSCREGVLAALSRDWERDRWHDGGPGRLLATAAAAHTGTLPADAIRAQVTIVQPTSPSFSAVPRPPELVPVPATLQHGADFKPKWIRDRRGYVWFVREAVEHWKHPGSAAETFGRAGLTERWVLRVWGPFPGQPSQRGEFVMTAETYGDRPGWFIKPA